MGDGAEPRAARYNAFISYSHRDAAFARRLHRRLETYRFPRRLRGRRRVGGPGSDRLGPIFRDREDLAAAADLSDAVRAAIAASSHLIVVCSPSGAASEWVGREIRLFRDLRGDDAILAALCEGSVATAFPPELRRPRPDGRARSPLAADFRPEGDGQRLALLKLVAACAGLRLDDLVQRDAQRRVRRTAAVSAASIVGMAAASLLAVAALQGRAAAEAERARGEQVIEFMLTDLRGRLKSVGRLDVLDAVNRGALEYYASQDLAHLPDAGLRQRAKLLQAIGEDAEKRGDLGGAQAQFDEAKRTTTVLLRGHPDDPDNIYAHGQSEYWSGFIRWRRGDAAGALAGFEAYSALARRLARLGPQNPDWLMEAGYADSNLGAFVLRRSKDWARAAALFNSAMADFQMALARKAGDRNIRGQIADGYGWLADAQRVKGDYGQARRFRLEQKAILADLLAADARDFDVRVAMMSVTLALARLSLLEGDVMEAVKQLREGRFEAHRLARIEPSDDEVSTVLRMFDLYEVRAWFERPGSDRPLRSSLEGLLGDCSAEMSVPGRRDLGSFCMILKARLAAERGDIREASDLRDRAEVRGVLGGMMLSEHGLIDLARESEFNISLSFR